LFSDQKTISFIISKYLPGILIDSLLQFKIDVYLNGLPFQGRVKQILFLFCHLLQWLNFYNPDINPDAFKLCKNISRMLIL